VRVFVCRNPTAPLGVSSRNRKRDRYATRGMRMSYAPSDEQEAKVRKVALLASRANFALSIPLVLCMVSATHGMPF
jgi:hypothetical protein